MRQSTPRRSAIALAVLALSSVPAAAQPAGFEDLLGTWHADDWRSVEIGPDTVTFVTPESRWTVEPVNCPMHFEHTFRHRTGADIITWFGLDDISPPAGPDIAGWVPGVLEAVPDTQAPMPTVWSYCAAETHGGTLYFPSGSETLTGIASVEGDLQLHHYFRQVPPPSHDDLSSRERIQVQEVLTRLGFYEGDLVHEFGPSVEKAIRAYQRSVGAEPTGVLTRRQVIALLRSP